MYKDCNGMQQSRFIDRSGVEKEDVLDVVISGVTGDKVIEVSGCFL